MMKLKSALIACTVIFLLPFIIGCDPCMNNPCTDGLACNGLETCTADGGQAVCDDGTPVDCPAGQICREPDGDCVEGCATNEDCDDGDLCTTDTCQDGTCVNDQVECQDNETCDPLTGLCAESETGTVGALIGATGVYSGAGTCGDDDDEVTLSLDDNTLILGGFTGNDDIPLTLTNDTTATASNVVAFEQSGHDMTIKIETEIVSLNLVHVVSGASCSSELMFAPGEPPDGYTICGPGCISPGTGGPPLSPEIWCTNQSGCSARAASCECRLVSRDRTSGGDWDHEADSNDKRKSDLANLEYRCMCLSKP